MHTNSFKGVCWGLFICLLSIAIKDSLYAQTFSASSRPSSELATIGRAQVSWTIEFSPSSLSSIVEDEYLRRVIDELADSFANSESFREQLKKHSDAELLDIWKCLDRVQVFGLDLTETNSGTLIQAEGTNSELLEILKDAILEADPTSQIPILSLRDKEGSTSSSRISELVIWLGDPSIEIAELLELTNAKTPRHIFQSSTIAGQATAMHDGGELASGYIDLLGDRFSESLSNSIEGLDQFTSAYFVVTSDGHFPIVHIFLGITAPRKAVAKLFSTSKLPISPSEWMPNTTASFVSAGLDVEEVVEGLRSIPNSRKLEWPFPYFVEWVRLQRLSAGEADLYEEFAENCTGVVSSARVLMGSRRLNDYAIIEAVQCKNEDIASEAVKFTGEWLSFRRIRGFIGGHDAYVAENRTGGWLLNPLTERYFPIDKSVSATVKYRSHQPGIIALGDTILYSSDSESLKAAAQAYDDPSLRLSRVFGVEKVHAPVEGMSEFGIIIVYRMSLFARMVKTFLEEKGIRQQSLRGIHPRLIEVVQARQEGEESIGELSIDRATIFERDLVVRVFDHSKGVMITVTAEDCRIESPSQADE